MTAPDSPADSPRTEYERRQAARRQTCTLAAALAERCSNLRLAAFLTLLGLFIGVAAADWT